VHPSRQYPIEPQSPDWPERFARAALENITRTYPNAPALVLAEREDLKPPEELHPTFYGSFDWHSSVHMHWSLIRLLRTFPDLPSAAAARDVLVWHFRREALQREREYLQRFPTFERPYGWGWALALVSEVIAWRDAPAAIDPEPLSTLAGEIARMLQSHLRISHYPNRAGTHGNSAFAMILALEFARVNADSELESSISTAAKRWYGHDRDAPLAFEPSGEDFLSPILSEAHLLSCILPNDEFGEWLSRFLPNFHDRVPPPLATLPVVGDARDGRIAHLLGLVLSRAWSMAGIAAALPADDPRKHAGTSAAVKLTRAGLRSVLSGNYETDHWLISFALLAMDGLRRQSPLAAPEKSGDNRVEGG
jgi:hypothetical protein